jgi:hypothetical protein
MSIHNTQLAKLFQLTASKIQGRKIYDSNHFAMGTIDDITERFGTQIIVICPRNREAEAVFALEVPLDSVTFYRGNDGESFGLVDPYEISDTLVHAQDAGNLGAIPSVKH